MGKTAVPSLTRQPLENVAEKTPSERCPGAPKLDPRVRRTRKLLEGAMRELMRERGYNEISVGDIAERATVNRATFYAHFEDKRDLAATMIREELHDALVGSFVDRGPLNVDRLGRAATVLFEFVARTYGACPKQADDFGHSIGPTIQATLAEFLGHWLALEPDGRRAFSGARSETAVSMMAWSLYGAATEWSHTARKSNAESAAREVVAILLR